jgi:hypothetical protein
LKVFALAAAAALLAGCAREPMLARGPDLVCDMTYQIVRGATPEDSTARLKLRVDHGGVSDGWAVREVEVTQPLAAGDFDPWEQFRTKRRRAFFAVQGDNIVLAKASGRPLTLNRRTGDLSWNLERAFGETEYFGACRNGA